MVSRLSVLALEFSHLGQQQSVTNACSRLAGWYCFAELSAAVSWLFFERPRIFCLFPRYNEHMERMPQPIEMRMNLGSRVLAE